VGGAFHQFELVAFLITVTTALGLLAVSTTVVDSLMLYILPEKERYARAKYENTEESLVTTPTGLIPQIDHRDLSSLSLASRVHSNDDAMLHDDFAPRAESSLEQLSLSLLQRDD
jgi:hypothetical protein